jgi:hypothetical protein
LVLPAALRIWGKILKKKRKTKKRKKQKPKPKCLLLALVILSAFLAQRSCTYIGSILSHYSGRSAFRIANLFGRSRSTRRFTVFLLFGSVRNRTRESRDLRLVQLADQIGLGNLKKRDEEVFFSFLFVFETKMTSSTIMCLNSDGIPLTLVPSSDLGAEGCSCPL